MELSQIIRRLLAHKILLTGVLIAAVALAWLAGSRTESTSTGAATTQILIDAPQSALANLKQNTLPLTTRAGMFAQFMASTDVREAIAEASGIPAEQIAARGPFDDPAAAPTGVATGEEPAAADAAETPYVLTFVAQQELPLITVYAQAPDAASAARLAGSVAEGVQRYVNDLQAQGSLPSNDRVTIRGLGTPDGTTVAGGSAAPIMVGVFLVVTLFGCILVLLPFGRRDADRSEQYEDWSQEYQGAFGLEPEPDSALADRAREPAPSRSRSAGGRPAVIAGCPPA